MLRPIPLFVLLLFAGALAVFLLHDVRKDSSARDLVHEADSNFPTAESQVPSMAAGRRKAALRGESQRPSREETYELMKRIRFDDLHLPDQNLAGHIADLNRQLEQAGVAENQLRIVMDSRLERDWQDEKVASEGPIFPGFHLREVPLRDALIYIMDSSVLRYNIEEGRLIFTSWKYEEDPTPANEKAVDEPPLEAYPGEPDPFLNEADFPASSGAER